MAVKTTCTCPGCDLWLRLEAERHDTTWRKKPGDPEPVLADPVADKAARKAVERRESMFFNAGRYAQGARDKTAVKAFEQLRIEQGL
jgi:hypothetical protein